MCKYIHWYRNIVRSRGLNAKQSFGVVLRPARKEVRKNHTSKNRTSLKLNPHMFQHNWQWIVVFQPNRYWFVTFKFLTKNEFFGSNISFIINDWQHLMYPIRKFASCSLQCFFCANCTKGHFLAADPQKKSAKILKNARDEGHDHVTSFECNTGCIDSMIM